MAAITIAQGYGSKIVATHQPVVFFWDVDWTGEATRPEVKVQLYDAMPLYDSAPIELLAEQVALPWADLGPTVTRYRWDGAQLLRSVLGSFDDIAQTTDTIEPMLTMWRRVAVTAVEQDELNDVVSDFIITHATAQWGQDIDWTGSGPSTLYTVGGQVNYLYYFHKAGTYPYTPADLQIGAVLVSGAVAGLYRYAYTPTADQTILVKEAGATVQTVSVQLYEVCAAHMVKYLDKLGQYRHIAFNEYVEASQSPTEIGKVEYVGAGTFYDFAPNRSVGYRNDRTAVLTAETLPVALYETLAEIAESPRVYYTPTNSIAWVLVSVEGPALVRPPKEQFIEFSIAVKLPPRNTITLL